jgi:predicted membrane metal-binding protein
MNLRLLLLVFAFVCFVLSIFPPASPHWQRLIGAGLAFATAAVLFS